MSKQCLNCGREISGVGNNKIFCDDCFRLIASFLQEIRSENEPATSVFEKNRERIRAAGVNREAESYIEKCCVRYDSKKSGAAAAAAGTAAAAGAAAAGAARDVPQQAPAEAPAPEAHRHQSTHQNDRIMEDMPDPFASVRDAAATGAGAAVDGSVKPFTTADFNAVTGGQQPPKRPPQKMRPQRKVYDYEADTAPMDDIDATSIFTPVSANNGESAPVSPDPDMYDAAVYAGIAGLGAVNGAANGDMNGGGNENPPENGDSGDGAAAAAAGAAGIAGAAAGAAARPPRSRAGDQRPSGGGSGNGGNGGSGGGDDDDDDGDDDGAKRRLILICVAAALALILFIVLISFGMLGGRKTPSETAGGTGTSQRPGSTTRPPNSGHTTNPGYDGTSGTDPSDSVPPTGEHTEHVWVSATCTDPKRCTVCGATEGEPLGHDWETEFIWTNGNRTCVVNLTCKRDDSHMDTKSATVTEEVTDATCTEAGGAVYTATLEYDGKTFTDRKEDFPPTAPGHDWGDPTFTWSDDYSTCEVTFVCKRDETHKDTLKATVTSEDGGNVCTGAGSVTYTATVTHDGKKFTDKKTQTSGTSSGLGHDWGEPEFVWSDDYKTCKVTFTCKRDSSHTETENATVEVTGGDATCETGGNATYTATVTHDGKTYTDKKTVTADALGHDWAEPTFEWSEDYKTCTVTVVCKRDDSHKKTENATVEGPSSVTEATCTEPGSETYTATVVIDGKTYTDTKKVEIPALGHDFSDGATSCRRCGETPARILRENESGKVYDTDLVVMVTRISGDTTVEDGMNVLTVNYWIENTASADGEAYDEGEFVLFFADGTSMRASGLDRDENGLAPGDVGDRVIMFKFSVDKKPLFLEYRSNYYEYGETSQYYSDHPERALYWAKE